MKFINTYGAETEKVVSSKKTQLPHGVGKKYFANLALQAKKRKAHPHIHTSDLKPKVIIGVQSDDLGEQGIDNGFNLLETATPVLSSLKDLHAVQIADLKTTQASLAEEHATVINMSIHPLGSRDSESYKKFVAPKGIYPYLWFRGWDHAAGIDARAQNSPATGVSLENAVDAVTAIVGAGAAIIALCANSPFEEGKASKYKESRLMIWEKMFQNSRSRADITLSEFPKKPFSNIAEYFLWMFGGNTSMHFIIDTANTREYKSLGDRILVPFEQISGIEMLKQKNISVVNLKDLLLKFPPQAQTITPNISHLEAMQWTQFLGARIRFKLNKKKDFPLDEFVKLTEQKSDKLEQLLKPFMEYTYIEGRDGGANFPDQEIVTARNTIANSVVIAPSALQAGLLQNLPKTMRFIRSYQWSTLAKLRQAAIRDGLTGAADGKSVHDFTKKIVTLADEGLAKQERSYLSYFEYVLKTKKNGADRAIEFVRNETGSMEEKLKKLIKSREVIC